MKTPPPPFASCVLQDYILSLEFSALADMEAILKPVSDFYEGPIVNRQGHNFPRETLLNFSRTKAMAAAHPQLTALVRQFETTKGLKYFIAFLKGDVKTKLHELRHAMYFVDPAYRERIAAIWASLTPKEQTNVAAFLTRLGYDPKVHLDEFQAYLFTEPANFWGMQLSIREEIPELAAADASGSGGGGKGGKGGRGRK